jgi:hypothetical protein
MVSGPARSAARLVTPSAATSDTVCRPGRSPAAPGHPISLLPAKDNISYHRSFALLDDQVHQARIQS